VTEITTECIEAYRTYPEAINLHERFLEAQAVPLFGKAIAIDPSFAMALAKLAVVTGNLGLTDQSEACARRALDHSERLTPRGVECRSRPHEVEREPGAAAARQATLTPRGSVTFPSALWGDGDTDRDRVAAAGRKHGSASP
jgi:tetratricopeptide (TPR) repeat protein